MGAILTQGTAWGNVERAITNLRKARLLTPEAMERVSRKRLARLIRSSGYFRQKAKRLKAFTSFLREKFGGSIHRMFRTPLSELRENLLGVYGIGPETADSILLYAGGKPVFVVDGYTKRILARHGVISPRASYEEIRSLFERSLAPDAAMGNEYHALIVQAGKNWCHRRAPRCEGCPLLALLPPGGPIGAEVHE